MDPERVVSLLGAWREPGPLADDLRNGVVAAGSQLRATEEYGNILDSMARAYGNVAFRRLPAQPLTPIILAEAFYAGLDLGLAFAVVDDERWEL